jgi:hypothetical protein
MALFVRKVIENVKGVLVMVELMTKLTSSTASVLSG